MTQIFTQADTKLRDRDEYVAMSAIWFDDKLVHPNQPKNIGTGYVIAGLRHHNCWATKALLTGLGPSEIKLPSGDIVNISTFGGYSRPIQGFLTSKDRFLTREEAARLAHTAGQIPNWSEGDSLASEELY